ncbi:phosphotransferase [Microbacterium sp.]|uniref:phosphotransferase n=1 Tax=Microbacterium sp. TaxID=51671 RepID=UPI002FE0C7D9
MHEGELALDDELARRLIADSFPDLGDQVLQRVRAAGTVNTIVRVGDDLVARFPLAAAMREDLAAEGAAMSAFAAVCPFPAPLPHGIGSGNESYRSAWAMQTWVPGETAGFDAHAGSSSLATDLSELILSLRTVEVGGRVFDGQGRGGDLRDHDGWVTECLSKSDHLLDVPRTTALWQALRDLPRSGPDVMGHRDLTPFNLLVGRRAGLDRLVGVLDSGSFGPVDRALDLVCAWHLFDPQPRRLLRDRVAATETEWFRGAAWALQQAIGLGWYYERSNSAMAALGVSTIRRLLADEELSALLSRG